MGRGCEVAEDQAFSQEVLMRTGNYVHSFLYPLHESGGHIPTCGISACIFVVQIYILITLVSALPIPLLGPSSHSFATRGPGTAPWVKPTSRRLALLVSFVGTIGTEALGVPAPNAPPKTTTCAQVFLHPDSLTRTPNLHLRNPAGWPYQPVTTC